jgi:hypothetical protein
MKSYPFAWIELWCIYTGVFLKDNWLTTNLQLKSFSWNLSPPVSTSFCSCGGLEINVFVTCIIGRMEWTRLHQISLSSALCRSSGFGSNCCKHHSRATTSRIWNMYIDQNCEKRIDLWWKERCICCQLFNEYTMSIFLNCLLIAVC